MRIPKDDTSFDREIARLEGRLVELRPAIAEAQRISRRLEVLRAVVTGRLEGRQRWPTAVRAQPITELVHERPRTRAELATLLGVTQARVSQLVTSLLREGRLIQLEDSRLSMVPSVRLKVGSWEEGP